MELLLGIAPTQKPPLWYCSDADTAKAPRCGNGRGIAALFLGGGSLVRVPVAESFEDSRLQSYALFRYRENIEIPIEMTKPVKTSWPWRKATRSSRSATRPGTTSSGTS
jgi:hypothetical protein